MRGYTMELGATLLIGCKPMFGFLKAMKSFSVEKKRIALSKLRFIRHAKRSGWDFASIRIFAVWVDAPQRTVPARASKF